METIEREGEVRDFESIWRKKDGTPVLVRESARVVHPPSGGEPYYEGVVEDITAKRKAEEAMRQAEREREQFYRFLVHDLNKPLAAIAGYAVDLCADPELPESMREPAQHIRNASTRLRTLVSEVLDYQKIQRGEISIRLKDFDLWEQIREIVGFVRTKTEKHQIVLGGRPLAQAGEFPAARIHSDPVLVGRIVQNLLDNALKYGQSRVEVTVMQSNGEMTLVIWNDGTSIPPQDHERVFTEFFQRRTTRREGVGIGLASVRKLVTLLHGQVWVEIPPQGGTAFHVRLPVNRPEAFQTP